MKADDIAFDPASKSWGTVTAVFLDGIPIWFDKEVWKVEERSMTKEEFEKAYAEGSGMTLEELAEFGLVTVRCDCGEGGCEGWKMDIILEEEYLDERGPWGT